MRAQGIGGELRVGWERAATIGTWSLRPVDETVSDESIVDFQLVDVDPFWMDQGPTRLVLELGAASWTWDDISYRGGPVVRVKGAPVQGVIVIDGT